MMNFDLTCPNPCLQCRRCHDEVQIVSTQGASVQRVKGLALFCECGAQSFTSTSGGTDTVCSTLGSRNVRCKHKLYSTTGTTASSRQPSSCLLSVVPQHQARTGGGRGIAVALGGAPNVSCVASQGRCPCWLHEEIVSPCVACCPIIGRLPHNLTLHRVFIICIVLAGRLAPGRWWLLSSSLWQQQISI